MHLPPRCPCRIDGVFGELCNITVEQSCLNVGVQGQPGCRSGGGTGSSRGGIIVEQSCLNVGAQGQPGYTCVGAGGHGQQWGVPSPWSGAACMWVHRGNRGTRV